MKEAKEIKFKAYDDDRKKWSHEFTIMDVQSERTECNCNFVYDEDDSDYIFAFDYCKVVVVEDMTEEPEESSE